MQEPALDYLRHGQIPLFRLPVSLDAAGADVALLGVPHDAGTTYQPGARFAAEHVAAPPGRAEVRRSPLLISD